MDELIEQIASKTGVDPAVAQRAVAIILKFLAQEGPDGKVQSLLGTIPGAQEAVSNAPDISGGVMGVFNSLTSAGLGMGEVQGVTEQFIAFANDKVGEGTVREIVGSIPGLNQFV
jgi:dihydroxyacid dehydratase/phosphogluconate dehydratase